MRPCCCKRAKLLLLLLLLLRWPLRCLLACVLLLPAIAGRVFAGRGRGVLLVPARATTLALLLVLLRRRGSRSPPTFLHPAPAAAPAGRCCSLAMLPAAIIMIMCGLLAPPRMLRRAALRRLASGMLAAVLAMPALQGACHAQARQLPHTAPAGAALGRLLEVLQPCMQQARSMPVSQPGSHT